MPNLLPVGRVHGHRGRGGELTVRVAAGDASRWDGVDEVWLHHEDRPAVRFDVENDHAYGDRWVLKLAGLDDSTAAAAWRGAAVGVEAGRAPQLGEFEHWHAELVGLEVFREDESIGMVREVRPTAGTDLLIVEAKDGAELMVPMHRDIVVEVNVEAKRLTIDPPAGLLELNRGKDQN